MILGGRLRDDNKLWLPSSELEAEEERKGNNTHTPSLIYSSFFLLLLLPNTSTFTLTPTLILLLHFSSFLSIPTSHFRFYFYLTPALPVFYCLSLLELFNSDVVFFFNFSFFSFITLLTLLG